MIKIVNNIATSLSALALGACASGLLFVANVSQYFTNIKIIKDIPYGESSIHRLDLYLPENTSSSAVLPVFVFLHGGRWTDGRKEQYAFFVMRLAEHGYLVAVPDYTKYPEVKFPVFVEDSAKAVAWVYDHIDTYGGDVENIFLAGHSCGAHMGALITTDAHYLNAYNKDRSVINAFIGLAGPYAFTPDESDLKDMFGPPSQYSQMQVPSFIDGHQPPMFLLHGAKNNIVFTENIEKVKDAANEKGGIVQSKIYSNFNHTNIIAEFTWLKSGQRVEQNEIITDMLQFMDKYKR